MFCFTPHYAADGRGRSGRLSLSFFPGYTLISDGLATEIPGSSPMDDGLFLAPLCMTFHVHDGRPIDPANLGPSAHWWLYCIVYGCGIGEAGILPFLTPPECSNHPATTTGGKEHTMPDMSSGHTQLACAFSASATATKQACSPSGAGE